MHSFKRVLVLFMIFVSCTAAFAQQIGFKSYRFDGDKYREGEGAGAILVKDGYLPVTGTGAVREDPLPAGTGAAGIFCYVESSGGKLRSHSRVIAMPGVAVGVQGSGLSLAARTDAAGYLIIALPPGTYDIRLFGFSKRIIIEAGKTTLTTSRGGKRMVD